MAKNRKVSLKLSDSELEKLYPALDEVVEAVEKIAGTKAKEKHRDHLRNAIVGVLMETLKRLQKNLDEQLGADDE